MKELYKALTLLYRYAYDVAAGQDEDEAEEVMAAYDKLYDFLSEHEDEECTTK